MSKKYEEVLDAFVLWSVERYRTPSYLTVEECNLLELFIEFDNQRRAQEVCDPTISKKIVGRCVHDHKPITCTGECDTNCPHPFWDNANKALNWAFIIEGQRLKVRKVRL